MIADLHAHYPMHLIPPARGTPYELLTTARGRERRRDRLRAQLIGLAGRFANYRSFDSGPRVTVPLMRSGGVSVALSVLYSFWDELGLDRPYGAPPGPDYLPTLLRQLELVEADIRARHRGSARVVRGPEELEACLAAGEVALVHCVEGGFHLGPTPEGVEAAVGELARRGVAYVIPAHLFWRGVATNAPALPFLPDRLYRLLFPQPAAGLSELGRAAIRAMAREGVLIDISHMSAGALAETWALLDQVDPGGAVPVIASHACARLGRQEYALGEDTIARLARRDGVIGLILAQHQLNDGVRRRRTKRLEESLEVIFRHVDRIREITGSHRHVAIGSDFDGFIKPTMGGLESMADLPALEAALRRRYGDEDGERIAAGNALRVLRAGWRGAPPTPPADSAPPQG
jgi:microsomal dipeptidase-like Zn-dependent dipeptidase